MEHLFEYSATAFAALMAWLARNLHGDVKATKDELAKYKTHVAENYVTHKQISEVKDLIKDQSGRIDEILLLLQKDN